MPELAEVEVICKQLEKRICNKEITSIMVLLERMLRNSNKESLQSLVGDMFIRIWRRGKYIVIETKAGHILLIHLRMTGRLVYFAEHTINQDKYERLRFVFNDYSYVSYGDTRTLGAIYYFESWEHIDIKGFLELGVEPLSDHFTSEMCYNLTQKSKCPIKTFLLNQKYIAGLGNIYADEVLFASQIHPTRSANTLTRHECNRLYRNIRKILKLSIERGGTTFRDYQNGEGKKGNNQKYLCVYGRKDLNCYTCGAKLQSIVLGGRTTVFCQHCQK